MRKIYYIAHYSDSNDNKNRKAAPAADTKSECIIASLASLGYDVEVLSWCSPDIRNNYFDKHHGYVTNINDIPVRFFDSYCSKFRIIRIIGRRISWIKRKRYIKNNCINDNSIIIIYHSLGFLNLQKFLSKEKHPYILEMEEIYADVIKNKRIRKKEIQLAQKASAYIFPTQLLNKVINYNAKPNLIIHGTYQVEPERNVRLFDKDHIHCVYAGTFDPRKGGCAAAAAAEFLPANYHIHVIGFGSKQDTENIKKLVLDISKKSKAKVTYDGLKSGEEYIQFIQSCDIGLSTQDPSAAFNATSFPSKVLSYLANGLRVVSIRIPAIEESAVGDMLFYYENQTPEEIAKAIESVNMDEEYDSRNRIRELDINFRNELRAMLDEKNKTIRIT